MKLLSSAHIFIVIILGACTVLYGDGYVFKNFTLEDGISQSSIMTIVQDAKGYLWFGTADGLNRYDGYEFKIYRNLPLDGQSISDNSVSAGFVDRQGTIWFGTFLGVLNKYNSRSESFERIRLDSLVPALKRNNFGNLELILNFSRRTEHSITSICEDNSGNLWISTWGKGLIVYNKASGKILNLLNDPRNPNSLSNNCVSQVLFDGKSTIWAATFGGGLNRLDIKILKYSGTQNEFMNSAIFDNVSADTPKPGMLSDKFVTTIFSDKKGNLWTGFYTGGLSCIHNPLTANLKKSLIVTHISLPASGADRKNKFMTLALEEDDDGNIWAGTFGDGMLRIKDEGRYLFLLKNDIYNSNSIASNDILSLLKDRTGIIWIGTSFSNGICKMVKSNLKFNFLTKTAEDKTGLNDKIIWSIYEDKAGDLWLGTYTGGVNRINRRQNHFTYYKREPGNSNSISSNHVRTIIEDRFGGMWFGTFSGGLDRLDLRTGKFTHYCNDPSDPNSIASNQIQKLYIDSGDTLWICTFTGGLNYLPLRDLYNGHLPKFGKYTHSPSNSYSINSDRVYTILEGKDGIFWIGTYGGGVCRFDRKKGTFFTYQNIPGNSNSLTDNRAMALHEDEDGNIWVGLNGGGINCIDRNTGSVIRYNEKSGLMSQTIYSILEDEHDNFWMSTDNGIYKFEESSKSFIHYNYHDGLQSTEFNGGAYFKSRKGEFFFGGVNGVNFFFPDSVKKNNHVPPIVIHDFKVFDSDIKGDLESIKLSYNQNFITFEFAALDYSNPQANRYAYILEGFDKTWHYTDSKYRVAHYTNLPHGQYTFRVKGCNNDGVWNEAGACLQLTIDPPFWLSWWFISLCMLGVSTPMYLVLKFRYDKIKSIARLKSKLAADIHDNLGADLTEITILSELIAHELKDSMPNTQEKLKSIARTARKLIDDFSDTIWIINPNRDSLYDLLNRLKNTHDELFTYLGINLNIHNLERLQDIKLNSEYRQNLYLILKEGINNSVKHSKCKSIDMNIAVRRDIIHISLKDDGTGFIPKTKKTGFGLQNLRNRAKLIGGKVFWQNSPSGGTIISFVGRINNRMPLIKLLRTSLKSPVSLFKHK